MAIACSYQQDWSEGMLSWGTLEVAFHSITVGACSFALGLMPDEMLHYARRVGSSIGTMVSYFYSLGGR